MRKRSADQDTMMTGRVMDPPGHAEIAERAFALYARRGGVDGCDLEDWLQAERELTDAHARAVAIDRALAIDEPAMVDKYDAALSA